jgi:hypothetical protein
VFQRKGDFYVLKVDGKEITYTENVQSCLMLDSSLCTPIFSIDNASFKYKISLCLEHSVFLYLKWKDYFLVPLCYVGPSCFLCSIIDYTYLSQYDPETRNSRFRTKYALDLVGISLVIIEDVYVGA